MALALGQAIYGERNRGHRLLAASPVFPAADSLAGRMDMQGSPPPHTAWQPYLSGFAWQDHFIFARTMPDPQATRAGMVFSRAIAMPCGDASRCVDILGLFEMLAEMGDNRDPSGDLLWRPGSRDPKGSIGLVQAILAKGPAPVVWPGQDGFDLALAHLWKALWPAARLSLSFRIAFSPTDVTADAPTVVTTPVDLLSRWSGFSIAQADAARRMDDAAEEYLVDQLPSGSLGEAIQAFGSRLRDISDLKAIVELANLCVGEGTFAEYVDGLRRVCHLAPERAVGGGMKALLVERAASALATADATEIRMARNLDLAAATTASFFWQALSGWAEVQLWQESQPAMIATVLDEAMSTKPLAEWRGAIVEGFGRTFAEANASRASELWQVLAVRPQLLGKMMGLGDRRSRDLERTLLFKVPSKLSRTAASAIGAQALRHKLTSVHAACCAASLPPVEAIRMHVSEATVDLRTLAIAARDATAADLVTAALEHDDELTLSLASQAISRKPALLRNVEVARPRWRALWAKAIGISAEMATAPTKPDRTMAALLDGIVDGHFKDDELIEALSATKMADLTPYSRRGEVWPILGEPGRSRFLNSTADGWLRKAAAGEDMECDDVLASVVVRSALLDPILTQLAGEVSRGCVLFRSIPLLEERRFEQWFVTILQRPRRLIKSEAEALGRLIAARNWERSAALLADAITEDGRSDLRPAVDYIVEMVGIIRRYYLDETGSRTPVAAKWRILEEIALELYGWGPGEDSLWQRAGGKDSEIPKTPTGAESWRKVLGDAQKGKGSVDIDKIIKTMVEDYPHNRALQKLRWDSAFEVRRR